MSVDNNHDINTRNNNIVKRVIHICRANINKNLVKTNLFENMVVIDRCNYIVVYIFLLFNFLETKCNFVNRGYLPFYVFFVYVFCGIVCVANEAFQIRLLLILNWGIADTSLKSRRHGEDEKILYSFLDINDRNRAQPSEIMAFEEE